MRIARPRLARLGLVFILVYPGFAADVATDEYRGQRIEQIRFDPPQQPIPSDQLQKILRLTPQTPLQPAQVRSAIKALYATGRFADVAVEAEPATGGGVTLLIRTIDQWFIGPVEVRGKIKAPPNEGQLANATRLELGQPYEEN